MHYRETLKTYTAISTYWVWPCVVVDRDELGNPPVFLISLFSMEVVVHSIQHVDLYVIG